MAEKRDRTFAYVRRNQVEDYFRMGWIFIPALEDTHHGRWSVLMEWICDCPIPMQKRNP